MSGIKIVGTTGGAIATGTSAKTLLQAVAAANHRAVATGFGISFDGTTPNAGRVLVELLYQNDAGTMTAAGAAIKRNPSDQETVQTTIRTNATIQPTDSSQILRQYLVDPEWGYTELWDEENNIVIEGGGRLGIRVTSPTAVNAVAWLDMTE